MSRLLSAMGNESSNMQYHLSDRPVEVTSEWTIQSATQEDEVPITVFLAQSKGRTSASASFSKLVKNLKVYRHPNILRYIASDSISSLATEPVVPLSTCLKQQSPLQVCLGLYAILKAITFLHKASCSHNNISRAAIFVTPQGSWKLGGLEFLCKFSEVTSEMLHETRTRRYDHSIPPEEASGGGRLVADVHSRDAFAFGVLVEEILANRNEHDDLPDTDTFYEFAKVHLQSSTPKNRPQLSTVLDHPYFDSNFIAVHNFLCELPIKSASEKEEFFKTLASKLRALPEEMAAAQLGELLVGRLVLLNETARCWLLPHLLTPGGTSTSSDIEPIFGPDTFKKYLIPHLIKVLQVLDSTIRLVLLQHFNSFCSLFPRDELQDIVVPQLLLGIKDTNDSLVAASLRALADIVPILGSEKVIGGRRNKIFADGLPKVLSSANGSSGGRSLEKQVERLRRKDERKQHLQEKRKQKENATISVEVTPSDNADEPIQNSSSNIVFENNTLLVRHPPDGGESDENDTVDSWSEWEDTTGPENVYAPALSSDILPTSLVPAISSSSSSKTMSVIDFNDLDIKVSSSAMEQDFFSDMEPVISKQTPVLVPQKEEPKLQNKFECKVSADENGAEEGWGDDLNWGEDL